MPLDSCISDLFEPGNIGSDSGSVTTASYNGYELTQDGARISIQSTTAPIGVPLTLTVTSPIYIVGNVCLSGSI